MYPFSQDLVLSQGIYNENQYVGMASLDSIRQSSGIDPAMASYINSQAVYAFGSDANFGVKNFPILMETQGRGRKRGVTSYDGMVYNMIFGKPKKVSVIARSIQYGTATVGLNYQPFYVIYKDRHFYKGQVVTAGGIMGNAQMQIKDNGVKEGNGWKFQCQVFGKSTDFIRVEYLRANSIWAEGVVKVSLEHSRGTESRGYGPSRVKNKLSLIRESINVAGNAAKKVLNFTIKADGKSFNMYYDWEKYLKELSWNAKKENDILLSRMNEDDNGFTQNVDLDSGKPIPSGHGIIKQIPDTHIMSYTRMTERKLDTFLTDTLDISSNLDVDLTKPKVIDVMGGYGLFQEIDYAMKRSMNTLNLIQNSDIVVKKNNEGGLTYGGYFTQYQHRSGAIYRFTHHPFFDTSAIAQSAPRHPVTGRPITSYEGIILNFSEISMGDGKTAPNIEYLYEEGREYVEGMVRGMAYIEGKQGGDIATDIDASSLHMMASQGVHVNQPLGLGYVKCKLS